MIDARPVALMKVLVADDNKDSADSLAQLIQMELGCEVVTAYDGEQALALATATPYDVLILDLKMPQLSGLEVAIAFRDGVQSEKLPLLLAMTGRSDLVDELALVDACFDRAFAKPVDHATLYQTLRAHWQGIVRVRAPVRFKAFEILAQAARKVQPLMDAARHAMSFDCQGPELVLHGDDLALHSAFYRLMCGALDLMGDGVIMIVATSSLDKNGGAELTVTIAGSDVPDSSPRQAETLRRLGLMVDVMASASLNAAGLVSAQGACPNSGGSVSYASHPSEGVLLRLGLNVQLVDSEPQPTVDGARVWIVDGHGIEAAVLERRLQRVGWRVWRFASPSEAMAAFEGSSVSGHPALVLVRDQPLTSRSVLAALRAQAPARTRCLLLVGAGADVLGDPDSRFGWELQVEPLSPDDLAQASLLAQDADASTFGSATVSHGMLGRRKVLVVDDNEVNRIVACGLFQVLGYEVAAVADGLDAIEYCKQTPPDLVLMDVDMPVLGGIDASRHLIELQKHGRVPPFAIVVATANDSSTTMKRCFDAGVSGYICKPLRLEVMRAELRRVGLVPTID